MNRKIDLGEDKNFFKQADDAKSTAKMTSLLLDDLPKNPTDALFEAKSSENLNWINSDPLLTAYQDEEGKSYLFFLEEELHKQVILLHIWDFTVLQCLRELDYIREWYRRYSPAGFIIVGVHTPMFEFGKDRKNVLDAVRLLDIEYPVVMDNKFDIWKSIENQCWPRRVLFDSNAKVYDSIDGEGNYPEFEKHIQDLLRNLSPGLACPLLMKPLRPIDQPDFNPAAVSPEIFFGTKRNNKLGNRITNIPEGEEVEFPPERALAENIPYLGGSWVLTEESVFAIPRSTSKYPSTMTFTFTGTDIYLVANTRAKVPGDIPQSIRVQVTVDKKTVMEDFFGEDLKFSEFRRSEVLVRGPKLYHLVRNLEHKTHELTLQIENSLTDTVEIFGIYFSSEPKKSEN